MEAALNSVPIAGAALACCASDGYISRTVKVREFREVAHQEVQVLLSGSSIDSSATAEQRLAENKACARNYIEQAPEYLLDLVTWQGGKHAVTNRYLLSDFLASLTVGIYALALVHIKKEAYHVRRNFRHASHQANLF